ncbi:hypothetical protein [Defluviitalea raffinosedens]|jgi:hypothetical protein|uniref:Uncharacterized protein n=1 Tax=Defluviitalea raffinosedens TaxID=1450156 RepID=A0A7C8LJI4_9FIRM|nr:hypothetical protein [Defluviitalea raffinosedens]KAE9629855.1 hypothetical protein GND95_13040 [Defluviitalea raffinosedens]MBM7686655.1 hypothetical protein [Defluviitalea raffinosedens]HHW67862.1 hypothetical protein [Candidatus Epulonipiscium sp.]
MSKVKSKNPDPTHTSRNQDKQNHTNNPKDLLLDTESAQELMTFKTDKKHKQQ